MNRITIIQDDGLVGIDGDFRAVDLTPLDPQIHAIQFNVTSGKGEIEWDADASGNREPNQLITDITPYQWALDAWVSAAPQTPNPEPEPEPIPPTFEELKALKIEAINEERDLREVSGFAYLGKVFDSDERSTDRIQIAALAAQAAITTGNEYSVNWTTADNSVIALDAPGVLGMVVAFAQHGSQLHETAKTLKAQAASATTAAQLEQIVWPS